ncbi:hypothetical protein C0989_001755 [Termitomyces sp. Mn162]|nr:hypothetical protein C0989_001755 [Termitomyces sp. Mn162]
MDIFARPITSNHTRTLERRVHPGSYAIMTPINRFLIYDQKHDSYAVYVKFGDGLENRHKLYSTHNPSVAITHREDHELYMGKWMEEEILRPFAEQAQTNYQMHKEPMKVQVLGSTNIGGDTEWYEIFLGSDVRVARKCKSELATAFMQYGKDEDEKSKRKVPTYDGLTADTYIAKVTNIIKKCARKGPAHELQILPGEEMYVPEGQLPPLSPETQSLRLRRSKRLHNHKAQQLTLEAQKIATEGGAQLTQKLEKAKISQEQRRR